ncbi:DoxX family protein [Roseivirga seohaensis subsp. aquiponti]|uniref:DoxX family protein n=1 Tax=Roseivirga seohaensis subsp. aquiponti TaxID=1566026 RepID=A0A0L8AKQ6_9BACT|nr:DoxX family membrane protein [Roseivirga seohaensis]KOF02816.1 DoxX family protein [Roseivirga seohaensis subsp. aquiponti]
MKNKKSKKIVSWILRLLAALIMLQTLFFKFSGAEESIYIFKQVGMEPWGRYLTGFVELIAGVFLLTNRYELGALLGLGTISGAIFFHLTKLGVEVQGDGGYLFMLAIVVFVSCTTILLVNFSEIKTKYLPNK